MSAASSFVRCIEGHHRTGTGSKILTQEQGPGRGPAFVGPVVADILAAIFSALV